ncbi:hypothetical protein ABGB07_37360 [Micromonosporaceae bacterium B7E4]
MLWLTWRQHRWQLVGIAAVVAVYCGYLVLTGMNARDMLDGCPSVYSSTPRPPSCDTTEALGMYGAVQEILLFGNLLPVLAGIFWGAPLVARELEQGTYRLSFTQSVPRRRWLTVKIGVLAGFAAIFGALVGTVVPWTMRQFEPVVAARPFGNDYAWGQTGAVSAAVWAFALILGAAVGLLLRRTMTAVAVTMAVLPLAILGLVLLRPHLLPPVTAAVGAQEMVPDTGGVFEKNDSRGILLDLSYRTADGQRLSSVTAGEICADPQNTYPTPQCLLDNHLKQILVYHPVSHYQWFQLIETASLLALGGITVVVLRRRLTHHLI